jgi:hypothetical protein
VRCAGLTSSESRSSDGVPARRHPLFIFPAFWVGWNLLSSGFGTKCPLVLFEGSVAVEGEILSGLSVFLQMGEWWTGYAMWDHHLALLLALSGWMERRWR